MNYVGAAPSSFLRSPGPHEPPQGLVRSVAGGRRNKVVSYSELGLVHEIWGCSEGLPGKGGGVFCLPLSQRAVLNVFSYKLRSTYADFGTQTTWLGMKY